MAPFGRIPQHQRSRVPASVGVKLTVPGKSAAVIRVVEAIRVRRVEAGVLDVHADRPRPLRTVARNRVPTPIGQSVTFCVMLRLIGGLRAFVGDELEDLRDRAADEHLALDARHR